MPSPQPQAEISAASSAVRNHPDRRVREPAAGGSGAFRRLREGPRAPFRRRLVSPFVREGGSAGGGEGGSVLLADPGPSPRRQRFIQASRSPRS